MLLQVEDAEKAMQAATKELRALQQQALAGTVTAVLVEEVLSTASVIVLLYQ
jgi:hypothetical protein